MSLLIYAVVGLAATWALYVGYLHIATRSSEGRTSDALHAAFPELEKRTGKALVYCFSPDCRPCVPMSRDVEKLIAAGEPLHKLDVHLHPELAREFGIRATPTLMVIENGVVKRMVLGVKTAGFLRGLLDPTNT